MGGGERNDRGTHRRRRKHSWLAHVLGYRMLLPEYQVHRVRNRRVYMANERTFLAWIRTALALMAFGFVIKRFDVFMQTVHPPYEPPQGIGLPSGSIVMILGALLAVLSTLRFIKVQWEIETDTFRPSIFLSLTLALLLVAVGFFLAISLL